MTSCGALPVPGRVAMETDPPPGAAQDDAEKDCLRRARAGDLVAYDELVQKYQDRIYGLIYHMTSNHEDSLDLAQDVFVKAWKALSSFKGGSSFYTWIYRIAVNHTLNHLKLRRNRAHHLSLNDVDLNPEADAETFGLVSESLPSEEVGLREMMQRLNEAMQQLSEDHRMVVTLHDIQGLPHEEIAGILQCNPGTVRSRLFYARQQLQALLSDFWKP
jgi:RNA polymerase sigma factor (sigma-70 family)